MTRRSSLSGEHSLEARSVGGRAVILAAFLIAGLALKSVEAATVGMVVNHGTASVTVFDVDTHAVLGNVSVSGDVLDCSVDGASNLGYVGDFEQHIWAIDVGAPTPALASGTNPIGSSVLTEDTALTPDRRFLLTCDGGLTAPVSVIDLATRTELSPFPLSGGCQGVEVCEDGSVLVVQFFSNTVRRLTIDAGGLLTDTGETLLVDGLFNTVCGKGGTAGVAISNFGSIQSFTIPGLNPVDTRSLSGFGGISGVVSSIGDRIYVRADSNVDGFAFDSSTGALGATPLVTIPVTAANTFFGVEQLALNGAATKLYVPEMNAVKIYSATSGVFVDAITDPSMNDAAGICLVSSICGNGTVEGGEGCDDANAVDGDGCDSNCTVTACGNGVVTAGEQCDDGNLANGDCCSSTCLAEADGTSCSDARFCNGADTCSAGACTQHAGDPCAGGAECNDVCNEGTDTCFAAAGSACADDGNACRSDQCNGAGVCTHPITPFVPCDDGVFCNGSDLCNSGGNCTIHNGDPCLFSECENRCDELSAVCLATTSGTPCFEDGNECTNDQCNGLGSCTHPPRPSGLGCASDGNVCTIDQCNGSGSCAHPPVVSGTPCANDGNPCTTDQCNGSGACGHPPVPDGAACSDASACTQTDECQSGLCVGTNPIVCPAPLCHEPGTCDPSTGTCSTCPAGYSQGGGGCQKTYAIGESLLDNQDSTCGIGHRYNDCFSAFGFHWSDTGDANVGPVIRVDVQLQTGVDCDFPSHFVTLNATSIATYPATNSCTCNPLPTPRLFADVDTSTYTKGGQNVVEISANECSGLSLDANGRYALVTVTYQDVGPQIDFRDDCRSSLKSKLKYKNDATGDDDVLNWKWSNGVATTQGDFADPTDSSDYQFCVFGEGSGAPELLIGAEVPANPTSWRALGAKGYKYKDKTAAEDGISKIVAKGGADGKAKIILKGKGAALSDPTLPLSPGTSGIRVQLTNPSTGICWESAFPFGTVSVDDTTIKGKVP